MPTPSPDRPRRLLLFKYDSCPYCRVVQSTIRTLGLDIEMRDTLMEAGARRELIDATGRGQVPCLFIDGEPLFESRDIMAWLEAYAASGVSAVPDGA